MATTPALEERRASGSAASSSAAEAGPDVVRLTHKTHMLAGAVAGIAEHLAMFPVDTIKTRMQALAHPGQRLHGYALTHALMAILRREGVAGLYGGCGAVALGAGPAHALYFSTYEMCKEQLGGNLPGHQPVATASSGVLATVASDTVMTPADVVKQRLQVARSPYKGVVDCILRVWREEGVRAFFRSYRTTLLMNVPFTAIHFATYESAKKVLRSQEDESLAVQLLAGGTAGAAAAAATNPLDVVKTRLQLEGVNSATKYGTTAVVPMLRRIIREESSKVLWSGLRARVLFHFPASAICWGTYETVKRFAGQGTAAM